MWPWELNAQKLKRTHANRQNIFIDLTTHAQHLETTANTESCSKYRKQQRRTLNSAEHSLDALLLLRFVTHEVWSVYTAASLHPFCCGSTLHMHTSQDLIEWKNRIYLFLWFLRSLHNNHISIIRPEIACSRKSIVMIMRKPQLWCLKSYTSPTNDEEEDDQYWDFGGFKGLWVLK